MTDTQAAPTFADYAASLTSAILLGADRRALPEAPVGPLGDLAVHVASQPIGRRALHQIAAAAAARRSAWRAEPPAPPALDAPVGIDPLAAPTPPGAIEASVADDARRDTPPAVTTTWRRIVRDWPILEDEWVDLVVRRGWRPGADLRLDLLIRARRTPRLFAGVMQSLGSLGEALTTLFPDLSPPRRRASAQADEEHAARVAQAAAIRQADATQVIPPIVAGLSNGTSGRPHLPTLAATVAAVEPSLLPALAGALERVDAPSSSFAVAHALADLARLRHLAVTQLMEPS